MARWSSRRPASHGTSSEVGMLAPARMPTSSPAVVAL